MAAASLNAADVEKPKAKPAQAAAEQEEGTTATLPPRPPPRVDGNCHTKGPRPFRVLTISLGGDRARQQAAQFSSPELASPAAGRPFELGFVPGVQLTGDDANQLACLVAAATAPPLSLFDSPTEDAPTAGHEDATVSAAGEAEEAVQGKSRHQYRSPKEAFRILAGSLDSSQKRVLACSLAHIRAMAVCADEGYDAILEDNVRVNKDAPALLQAMQTAAQWEAEGPSVVPAVEGWRLQYYGYLGREEDMEPARRKQQQQQQQQEEDTGAAAAYWGEWPIFTEERSGRSADLFWGAYAYSLTPPAARGFLRAVRLNFRTMLFRQRRRGVIKASPIDRAIPFCLRGGDERVPAAQRLACVAALSLSTPPLFFRAPMLASQLHTKWDTRFFDTTTAQLTLHGMGWDCVWLLPEERETVERMLADPARIKEPEQGYSTQVPAGNVGKGADELD